MHNPVRTGLVLTLIVLFVSVSAMASPLRVVTSTSLFADFVLQVGGERVHVSSIVPPGADPHTYEPTPREARDLAMADVLFVNGLGLELWLDRLLQNAASRDLKVVTLSAGLTPLAGISFVVPGHGHHDHHDHDHHHHEDGDPHFWLDVQHAIQYVQRIEETLAQADPQGASFYRERAAAYIAELSDLDRWIHEQIAQIPEERRVLLTYHDAFAYFAARYGLHLQGVVVRNPDREPSPRDLASLIAEVRRLGTPAIFAEPQINPKYAESLACEAGIKVGYLYSDALTAEVPTYMDMMRYNTLSLLEALR